MLQRFADICSMLEFNFTPFPVITTERLVLRKIIPDDVHDFFLLRADNEVMKYIDRPLLTSVEDAMGLVEKISNNLESNDGITWGISLKDDLVLIGSIGFWKTDKENHRAEIGYMLQPACQKKGIMQEAMTAVLQYAFTIMKLHSIEANVNPANQASIRLLENNRFVKEAYFKENYYFNGQFLDSVIFSLLNN